MLSLPVSQKEKIRKKEKKIDFILKRISLGGSSQTCFYIYL